MKLFRVFRDHLKIIYEDYKFDLVASVYNFSWYFDGDILKLVINYEPLTIATIREVGNDVLSVEVYSRSRVSKDLIMDLINYLLGLYEDLNDFYQLWKMDKLLSKSFNFLKGYRVRASPLWNSLLIGVCQQNASFKQGWKMVANLHTIFGKRINLENYGDIIIPPGPKDIINMNIKELESARVGYRAKIIMNIAEAFVNDILSNDFSNIHKISDLVKLEGVGHYTARLAQVLTYRIYDDPPVDRWLKRIINFVYDVPDKEAEAFWRRKWGRWSGLASLITTIALDAEVISKAIKRIKSGKIYPLKNIMSPMTLWRYI